MNLQEIMEKAKTLDIDTDRMNRLEVIRAIQQAQDKICCYGTEWVDYCGDAPCLWRNDCFELNHQRHTYPDWPITTGYAEKDLNEKDCNSL